MSTKSIYVIGTIVIAVFISIFAALVFLERVPEGEVAVVYSPSGGAKEVLNPGWTFIGLFEKAQHYPTRPSIVKTNISVTTNDGKKITMPVVYTVKVNKTKVLDIFKELGSQDIEAVQEGYLYQKLFKSARNVISKYSVIDIYGTKTSIASEEVRESMTKETELLGFAIKDVTLGTPELDEGTQKAIDARVKAAQQLETISLEKEIALKEAEKKKIVAQGEANAKIEEARGRAESFKILSQSITPELLKLKEVEARLKHGWVTIQGSATPLVQTK